MLPGFSAGSAAALVLGRFPGPDVGAHSLKGMGVALSLGSSENVGGGHQLQVRETGLLDRIQVLSLQESAADSSCPQVHVGLGPVGHGLVHHDVGQVEAAAGFQHPEDFRKYPVLVRAQVDDPVGDGNVH